MKKQQEHGRRALKIAIAAILAVVALALVGLAFVANFFFDFALNPQSKRQYMEPLNHAELGEDAPAPQDNPYVAADPVKWMNMSASTVRLNSRDGLRLFGYQALQPGSRYVIICHGYKNSALGMGAPASHFYGEGYSVLLPDARGHGGSEGTYIGMGWPERLDILDWIAQILQKDPDAEIALYGVSMGAATVMMASGEALPPNVKCVVADCGYTSAWDEFSYQLKDLYGLPSFPIMDAVDLLTRIKADYSIRDASAVKQVARSATPTLFIHGDADAFVPYGMLDELYSAASCEKEKLVIPGAGHAEAMSTDPETYWTAVDGFLARHFTPVQVG